MFGHSATEHIVSIYMFFLEDPCEVALHKPYPATLTVATGESSHKRRFIGSAAYPVKRWLVGSVKLPAGRPQGLETTCPIWTWWPFFL